MRKKKVDVLIKNYNTDEVVYEKKGFEAPEHWSQQSIDIVASKYSTNEEYSVFEIIERMTDQITQWGYERGYFDGDIDTFEVWDAFENKLKDLMLNQHIAFNTPSWCSLGVPDTPQVPHACYIGKVEDDLQSILRHVQTAGTIFSNGSGVGLNVSDIRGEGESLSNKGYSSGVLSFLRMWDKAAGIIRSGGRNRRSAVLIAMNADHRDIEKFIDSKSVEEKKAKILIANGVSPEEAYATVDFQNQNNSIVVTDEFMQSVIDDKDWELTNRTDKSVYKTVKAKELFRQIATRAWETGDPGLQFTDRINKDNPIPSKGSINSSNPCGEIFGVDYTSCHLCAINVLKYYDEETEQIKWSELRDTVHVVVKAMDMMIDGADYANDNFREVSVKSRPLGIGMTNFGALAMMRGYPYGSKKAVDFLYMLQNVITFYAAEASVELAKLLGPCEWYEEATAEAYKHVLKDKDDLIYELVKKHGIRNTQVTTSQPGGTVSFVLGADTTATEPLFAPEMLKTLSGGGTMTIKPECVTKAVKAEYARQDLVLSKEDLNSLPLEKLLEKLPESSRKIFRGANDITWEEHIDMFAAVSNTVSGGVSKTINLSSTATVEDVENAYMRAWEKGCKGVTVYRDGSKEMQPLSDAKKKEVVEVPKEVIEDPKEFIEPRVTRLRPAKDHGSHIHEANITGHSFRIIAGHYEDGSLCEIFINMSKEGSTLSGIMQGLSRIFSVSIQHGVPLQDLANQFKNLFFEPNGVTGNPKIMIAKSILDYVGRWLESNYITVESKEDDEDYEGLEEKVLSEPSEVHDKAWRRVEMDGPLCTECGGFTQRSGTCYYCPSCGSTNGCS